MDTRPSWAPGAARAVVACTSAAARYRSVVDVEDVRVAVYSCFAHEGRAPGTPELASEFGVGAAEVDEALRDLAAARHLVLDNAGRIVMAHPFSAIPLSFSVMGASTLWWGGCAWDSFAMAHLLTWEPELLVATRCPACATAHAWNVNRLAPPPGDQLAHFLTPVAQMWDDVIHTCGHQRIFCNQECIDIWLERTANPAGYVMDLPTLWRFAADWYTGRLDPGYVRREPSDAADYMRGVGLSGTFWGL